ncbi:MAG TPA: ATP-binding protein [Solirubrobacteraceae bacterium]|nr:ATP-binding protein [Solirubrobacteraceae bacterium]
MGGDAIGQSLDLELPAIPESCPRARYAVRATLQGTGVDMAAVDLAVSEAVTNVVVHAYRDVGATQAPGRLRVAVALDDGGAWVRVIDHGIGMRPRPDSPGLGFGLALIADACDLLEIRQREDGTQVHMRFRFAA